MRFDLGLPFYLFSLSIYFLFSTSLSLLLFLGGSCQIFYRISFSFNHRTFRCALHTCFSEFATYILNFSPCSRVDIVPLYVKRRSIITSWVPNILPAGSSCREEHTSITYLQDVSQDNAVHVAFNGLSKRGGGGIVFVHTHDTSLQPGH